MKYFPHCMSFVRRITTQRTNNSDSDDVFLLSPNMALKNWPIKWHTLTLMRRNSSGICHVSFQLRPLICGVIAIVMRSLCFQCRIHIIHIWIIRFQSLDFHLQFNCVTQLIMVHCSLQKQMTLEFSLIILRSQRFLRLSVTLTKADNANNVGLQIDCFL